MNDILADRYRLESEIARGAAGIVHRARDLITGEAVAVKVLHADAATDEAVATAFLDEAEVLSELNHPGIVRPRDLIVNGTVMALVMDLVDGVDLRRHLIDSGPVSPRRAAEITSQVATALAAVHAAGIVHGDVKPGNILVPSDGSPVRLVDFGVARRIACPDAPTHGTPDYTAPEIIDGEPSSAKSDVYGLGLVLFEALCARNPYRGGTIDDVLNRHRESMPLRPETVPVELWSIIESCLSLRPGSRPDADAVPPMLRAVTPVLGDEAAPAVAELPGLRARVSEPMVSTAPPAPVEATPTILQAVALPTDDRRARRGGVGKAALAGAAAGLVALAAAGALLFALSPEADPTDVSEQTNTTRDDTESSPAEDDPEPTEEPTSPDGDDAESTDDSTEDNGTGDDSGDGSDSENNPPQIPGEDLLGSPMPGRSGNG